jgi:hypothetical protein
VRRCDIITACGFNCSVADLEKLISELSLLVNPDPALDSGFLIR